MIAQSLLGRTIVSTRAREVGLRIFAIVFIFTLFLGGVQLRRWTGQNTRHVRYQHDIVNAFYWGQETLKEARRLSPGRRVCQFVDRIVPWISGALRSGKGRGVQRTITASIIRRCDS